jgi:hypothetical protein
MPEFDTNLSRAQLAATWFSLCLQTSRELFECSYLSLSVAKRLAVDQLELTQVSANYQVISPEWLAQQPRAPMGFQAPTATQPAVPTSTPPVQP